MTDTPNPILPLTSLLIAQMPAVYDRAMIYDPTWTNTVAYDAYIGEKIVPAVGSVVRDTDETALWVQSVDDATKIPTYVSFVINADNDNVVSLLDFGNTVFRLYYDNRALPYPVTPDSKCIFIGKSPRFYTLTRYYNTPQATVISQYFDQTGTFISQQVPLISLNSLNTSWYLPRAHTAVTLADNEAIQVTIYDETGSEVSSATMYSKESAVINEDVIYAPSIVGMTVSGNQQLANGTFYLYENQDFGSLGLTVNLVYGDGSTAIVPVDGVKCILYGQSDFIASFAGLVQPVTVKYYRSSSESINPGISDPTGEMISTTVPVTVIPNTLGVTVKIIPIPFYNGATANWVMQYWMYFADGRSHQDISGYVTQTPALQTNSAYYGVPQTTVVSVDMKQVDPAHYATSATYQQNVVITFGSPNTLVRYSFRDSASSQNIYGLDNAGSKRPVIRYDSVRKQYFVPTVTFVNLAGFVNSFYTQSTPPYDPTVSAIPQQPTHFVVRSRTDGRQLVAAPIPVASYGQAFSFIGDTTGAYNNTTVMVEFLNVISSSVTNILFAAPVDISTGSYLGT